MPASLSDMIGEPFEGEITVASRIVDQLSSGLYESPAACLKELINNSYDADATLVEVFIKPDADRIIVEDNGVGMNKAEFIKHFQKISESFKREESDVTSDGRKKIGKIGIGFIAANEICDTMEIFSTKARSRELLHVSVHFDKMREDPAARRRGASDFAKGDYTGEVLEIEPDEHFTQIILKRVRDPAKDLFAGETNNQTKRAPRTLYGKATESIKNELGDPDLASWSEFDSYSQNLLRVALNVPVPYFEGWVPNSVHSKVTEFEKDVAGLNFNLRYDGADLRKPIVLRPADRKKCLVRRFKLDGKSVGATGYFYVQHGVVKPRDLHGCLVRIRHAAIGGYDPSFLDFPPSEGSIIQRWVSAEIWADDRLEAALNIDRKTLRVTDPAYLELQAAVHAHLRKVLAQAREDIYEVGATERKTERARSAVDSVVKFATEEVRPIDQRAARQVIDSWEEVSARGAGAERFVKKYSVVELYRIVVEVARDVLEPEQLRRFVRELTRRILG